MKYFNFFEEEKNSNQKEIKLNEEDFIPNYTKLFKVPKYLEKVKLFYKINKYLNIK